VVPPRLERVRLVRRARQVRRGLGRAEGPAAGQVRLLFSPPCFPFSLTSNTLLPLQPLPPTLLDHRHLATPPAPTQEAEHLAPSAPVHLSLVAILAERRGRISTALEATEAVTADTLELVSVLVSEQVLGLDTLEDLVSLTGAFSTLLHLFYEAELTVPAHSYWPLYYGHGYYGDDEVRLSEIHLFPPNSPSSLEQYGPHSNSSRPGGALAVASFSPSSLADAATAPPEYMIYGRRQHHRRSRLGRVRRLAHVRHELVRDPPPSPQSRQRPLLLPLLLLRPLLLLLRLDLD
jgi:hypothetical protein